MGRGPRNDYPGARHHLTNRGTDGTPIFVTAADHRSFLSLIAQIEDRWGVEVHAWALMKNHYHLLVVSTRGELSAAMHFVDGTHTRRFNRAHDRVGALFQGRFHSEDVESEHYMAAAGRYIHMNPVRAGVVADAGDYRWSSCASYVGRRIVPRWLHTTEARIGRGPDDYEAALRFVGGAPARGARAHAVPPALATATDVLERLVGHVAAEFGVAPASLYVAVRGQRNVARLVMIGLGYEAGLAAEQLAAEFGLSGPASVRSAIRRLRDLCRSDPVVAASVEALREAA